MNPVGVGEHGLIGTRPQCHLELLRIGEGLVG